MFPARNRSHYQRIDDEFEEADMRSNCGNGLPPLASGSTSVYMSTSESMPLHTSLEEHDPDDTNVGPLLMGSSSREEAEQRWHHIGNLDEFFRRVYEYHQGGGFTCILWKNIWTLIQFLFIVFISTFLLQCIDYDILFNNKNLNATVPAPRKRYFGDAIVAECASHLNPWISLCIVGAVIFWMTCLIRTVAVLMKMKEVQAFYQTGLDIQDRDLSNITWADVVSAIDKAQPRLNLWVNKDTISAIDICHRILRYENYMVAMVNQGLLPTVLELPVLGSVFYMPRCLIANLEWLLFWGFRSPFCGSFVMRTEYKSAENYSALVQEMQKTMLWLGVANACLAPFIFIYQVFHSFFTAADLTKRDTGALGSRAYSNYGRYRVRHLNELSHELRSRLSRSHAFASAYVGQFFSPLLVIFAKNISFIAAAVFAPLTVLSVWDEDVLQVEHVLTVVTGCGLVVILCRALIPDDNLVIQPELLLDQVTSELHYVPDHWKNHAHDRRVLSEFESLFRLRAVNLLEELTSPLLTPFVLLFQIRFRCGELVEFLRDYTADAGKMGDLCSFSLLDVARHGDPNWQHCNLDGGDQPPKPTSAAGRDGKTEMSLVQMAVRNPSWMPPPASAAFLARLRGRIQADASALREGEGTGVLPRNLLSQSIHTLMSVPLAQPRWGVEGAGPSGPLLGGAAADSLAPAAFASPLMNALRHSSHGDSLANSLREACVESAGGEMRLTSLYLRALHSERRSMVSRVGGAYASMGPADESLFALPGENAANLASLAASRRPPPVTEEDEEQPPSFFPSV